MPSYDYIPCNEYLLYDGLMAEATGTLVHDWSKPHHTATMTGVPTWAVAPNDLVYQVFNGATPDFLEVAQADSVDLAFTTEDCSFAAWIYPTTIGGSGHTIVDRMQGNVGGWALHILQGAGGGEMVRFYSYPGALPDWTDSREDVIDMTQWWFVSASRDGDDVRLYVNGRDVTDFQSAHDTFGVPAVKFHVGIYSDETANPYYGAMWRPRVWGGKALSAAEWLSAFERERHLFGV